MSTQKLVSIPRTSPRKTRPATPRAPIDQTKCGGERQKQLESTLAKKARQRRLAVDIAPSGGPGSDVQLKSAR